MSRIIIHIYPFRIYLIRHRKITRKIALAGHNNYVDSTPVASSISYRIGNFVNMFESTKSEKLSKAIKKPLFLGEFGNIAIVHVDRDAMEALYQTRNFVKRWKNMRKREYAIGVRQPNGEYVVFIVTEHFHMLNVLAQMIVANDLGVERIAHRILHYATVRNRFVPNVVPPGHAPDLSSLLHIDLVNAFLLDQTNPVQVNTFTK